MKKGLKMGEKEVWGRKGLKWTGLLFLSMLAGLGAIIGSAAAGESKGPVLLLHFDKGSGTIAVDSSGNRNDGRIREAKWVEGKYGKALQFNGTRFSSVDLPPSQKILGRDVPSGTIALWVKPNWNPEDLPTRWKRDPRIPYHEVFIELGRQGKTGPVAPGGYYAFSLYQVKSSAGKGMLGACIPNRNSRARYQVLTPSPFQKNVWTHIAMTWSQPEGTLKLYVNGQLEAQNQAITEVPLLDNPRAKAHIGIWRYRRQPFNGSIDEVKIWKRALTEEEIKKEAGNIKETDQKKKARVIRASVIRARYKIKHSLWFKDRPKNLHNLVSNSSFEVGIKDWDRLNTSREGLGKITWELDKSTAVQGKVSLKIHQAQSLISEIISMGIPVNDKTGYTLSAYLKSDNPDMKVVMAGRPISLTREWKRYVLYFPRLPHAYWEKWGTISHPYPGSSRLFNIRMGFYGKGTVWVDAVQLEEGEVTPYQPPKMLETGIEADSEKVDKRFNIYKYKKGGTPVKLTVSLFNGSGEELIPVVNYKIKDFYDEIIKEGSLKFSLPPGTGESKEVTVSPDKKGIFRGLFTINSKRGVKKREITFAIISPLSNNEVGEDSFFGHSTGVAGGFNYERLVSMAEAIGMKYSEAYNASTYRGYFRKFFNQESPEDKVQAVLEKYNMIRLRTLPRPGVYWEKPLPKELTKEMVEDWRKRIVEKEATRYKGRIKYWEVCPELIADGTSMPPLYRAKEYVKLLKAAYTTIKKIDPSAVVIGGGGTEKKFSYQTEALFKAGGFDYLDAVSIHPYCSPESPEKADFEENLEKLKGIINKYGGGKDIWITEVGFMGVNKIYGDLPYGQASWAPVSERAQAEYMVRMNIIAQAKGIKRFMSFLLRSGRPIGAYYKWNFLNYDSPKIVYVAYNTMATMLRGSHYIKETNWGPMLKCYQFKEKNGNPLFAVWNYDEAGRPAYLNIQLKPGEIKVIDLMGNPLPLKENKGSLILEVTGSPLFLRPGKTSEDKFINAIRRAKIEIEGLKPLKLNAEINRETNTLVITLENQTPEEIEGQLELVSPAEWQLKEPKLSYGPLKAGETRKLKFTLKNVSPFKAYTLTIKAGYDGKRVIVSTFNLKPADIICKYTPTPPTIDGDLNDWPDVTPVRLAGAAVSNKYVWKGKADLSAKFYTLWDDKYFYFGAEVSDDIFKPAPPEAAMWKGDSIQMAFDMLNDGSKSGYDAGDYEYGLAQTKDGPQVYRWWGKGGKGLVKAVKLVVKRKKGKTYYEAAFPYATLSLSNIKPGKVIGFNLTFMDNDSSNLEKWLQLSPGITGGKDPSLFKKLIFVDKE